MALVVKDRIRETTTTTGIGTLTLAGAVSGFDAFSEVGNANTTYYSVVHRDANEWEVGIGTYTSSGTTLARTTVLASSNSGSATSFAAGTKDVFCTYPAAKSVYSDASGVVNISSVAITGGTVSGITDLAIADGGTGSGSASAARTSLGVAIGSDVQAYDADLAAIAGLAKTDGNVIVGNGTAWVAESGATARTSLGLGSISTQASNSVSISGGAITGITDLAIADGGTGSGSASAARTSLGVAIGSDVQAYDADLAAIAALAKTDGNVIIGNGAAWVAESGATARTSLGLGSIATQASSSVSISGGSITGITDLAIADGGTGSGSASAARTALGVAIGSDVQAYDADLAAIAALAKTDGNIIVGNGTAWVAESGATARTSLGLGSIATQASSSVSISGGAITGITDLAVADGGTGQGSYTNGQLLVGNTTGNTLAKATITAGTGISVTNGASAITIANTQSAGISMGKAIAAAIVFG